MATNIKAGSANRDRGPDKVREVGSSTGRALPCPDDGSPAGRLRKREQLVEEIEGQQVSGKGDAQRGGQSETAKNTEEARLRMLVQAAHVADGVERRENPQDSTPSRRKEHSEFIDAEHDRDIDARAIPSDRRCIRRAVPSLT